jgi:hypothetical protein
MRSAAYGNKDKKIALPKSIFIPKGTVLSSGPSVITLHEHHYELIIGIGKDHTATLLISESAMTVLKKIEPEVVII